jgi:hypothetical protein
MSRHYIVSPAVNIMTGTDSVMRLNIEEKWWNHRHGFLTTEISLLISHVLVCLRQKTYYFGFSD